MKNLARLILFFSVCFVILFLFSALFRFLGFWIDAVRLNSIGFELGAFLMEAIRMALPAALFFSILFSLSYTVRRKIPAPFSIFFIILLSGAFTLGFLMGTERIEASVLSLKIPSALNAGLRSRAGLILSRQDMTVVLLSEGGNAGESGSTLGISDYPRVVHFPERPMIYQEAPLGPNYSILPLPFKAGNPWLIQSVIIDFTIMARALNARFDDGLVLFGIYLCSLVFLLASLRFILNLSSWPLANLFLGALVFRLVLSLQIFLNTPETLVLLNSFLRNRFPDLLITPLVFCTLGCLIIIYTFLVFIARRKRRSDG